jgi:hypothetical protein
MFKGDYIGDLSKHAMFKGDYIGDLSKHAMFKKILYRRIFRRPKQTCRVLKRLGDLSKHGGWGNGIHYCECGSYIQMVDFVGTEGQYLFPQKR